jgi:hypothetical protein
MNAFAIMVCWLKRAASHARFKNQKGHQQGIGQTKTIV